jgi:hypothetical protein
MRIKVLIFLCLISAVILNGCIEITEEMTVNANGSGTVTLTIDIGALGASANGNNSQVDMSILDKIKKLPEDAPAILGKVDGISNIRAVNNSKSGIYSVGFDFINSKALNKAIYSMAGQKKKAVMPSFFKISKHKLIKKDISPYLRKVLKEQQQKNYNELFFSFISYKSIFHLPSVVSKASNIKSEQPDPKTVITKFTLDEMLKGGFNYGNVIRY